MSESSERPSIQLPLWAVAILLIGAFFSGGVTVSELIVYNASHLSAKSSNPNDYVYPDGTLPDSISSTPPMPSLLPNENNLHLVSVFRVIDKDHDTIYYQAVATVDDALFSKKAQQAHWKPVPHKPNSLPEISQSKQAFAQLLTKNQQKALACYASEHPKVQMHYGIDSLASSESVHDKDGNVVPSRYSTVEGMIMTPTCQEVDTVVGNEAILELGTDTILDGQDVPNDGGTTCPPGIDSDCGPVPNSEAPGF